MPHLVRHLVIACALSAPLSAVALTQAGPRPRAAAVTAVAPQHDSTLFQALEWRSIGPFRGGRVTTVAGVHSNPLVYYMGAVGGGVWKTEDAGISWRNITDGQIRTASVGAIAIADDDPNVIYIGMGEAPIRGVASAQGNGVYKSTDAGRTWKHVGLETTRTISAVVVHPRNNDVVYVAAQGTRWKPTQDRGVYKSADGGKTWRKTLFVSEVAGPSALAMDATNPRILYAAFWDHQRLPWQVRSGGPGSGIWKSTDEGETWTRLTEGLPKGQMGKIGLDVSPANPDRVWALIEAEPEGGLYRSDDAGKTWRRINENRDIRARPWYYLHVMADPKNAEVVYVMNAPFMKSIDGGRTFTNVAVPHGDNHALWINHHNPLNIINGNDGGANVSFNGGRSWSSQQNQPTAQFYRVSTDDMWPYRVYGGQQDNSSVAILSKNPSSFGIDWKDWDARAGCESAYLAFDPRDPRYTYGGCYQGIIEEHDAETGKTRNIQVWPALGLAEPSDLQKYRFNWNAPIITSPHDPKTIYHGGNRLFRSTDRGFNWTPVSPDLTKADRAKMGLGGAPLTNEGAGGEVYGTIYSVSESPVQRGLIWVGTDDGNVQVTRDGGTTWTNVTPRNGPGEGLINTIEASPHERGVAYIAVAKYKFGDDAPYAFRTTDYGQSWTPITTGFRPGEPVRVIREDPTKRGLLYAGTETGMYVSFNDGAQWQSLQRNLPVVPVTDLQLRQNDLVASTEGRAFWVLDDVTPLQQMAEAAQAVAASGPYLFKPRDAYRVEWGAPEAPGVGRNPPSGAVIRYALAQEPDTSREVKLEILDGAGQVIRTYSSRPRTDVVAPPPGGFGPPPPRPLPNRKGMNAFAWDMRTEAPVRVQGVFLVGNPNGYRVAPGQYSARLTAEGKTLTQSFAMLADPRERKSQAEYDRHVALARQIWQRVKDIHESVTEMRSVREQVTGVVNRIKERTDVQEINDVGKAITTRVDSLDNRLVQPRHKTFQDVINFRNGLSDQYMYLQEAIDGSEPPSSGGMTERFGEVEQEWAQWKAVIDRVVTDVERFNRLLREKGVEGVKAPRRTIS